MLAIAIAIRQFLSDAKSQRLRTILTTLGITWGTLALGLLLAFGRGLHANMRQQLSRAGENVVFAWTYRTYKSWEGFQKGRPLAIRDEDFEALKNQAVNLGAISPIGEGGMTVGYGAQVRDTDVSGVLPDYFVIRKMPVRPGGRYLSERDVAERRRVVFLGYRIAQQLTGEENPLGKDITLKGAPLTVVGVLDKPEDTGDGEGWDSDAVRIPYTTFKDLTGRETFNDFVFKPADPSRNGQTVASVREVLARRLKFDPTDKGALDFDDFTEFARSADAFMAAIALLLGSAGLLTLVAGGVGVSNIMRVSVQERTHDIGIRMALGAKSRLIMISFLLETLLLTALGGILGLAAAWGIIAVFPRFGLKSFVGTPSLSWGLYLGIVAVLGFVGLLAGYGPARRASRMDPVFAMKV